jgi:hypothetical protein
MMDDAFETARLALRELLFREDFERALCELYRRASPAQRATLRDAYRAGGLGEPRTWRNPTDYERGDLTREQRMRQTLIFMSIEDGGPDYRDDLMAIAYCYHNLALLGLNADAELRELADMSAPAFASLVRGFVERHPEEKSAKSFGLRFTTTPEGRIAEFAP